MSEAFTLKYWANVWLFYCLFDSSYAEDKSYGFWIDSGNGFSTLVPSVLFIVGLSVDILSPINLGLLGMIMFYQEFYGTVLYFWSYCYQQRYRERGWKGRNLKLNLIIVALANGLWMYAPGYGMYLCYQLVQNGDAALASIRGL